MRREGAAGSLASPRHHIHKRCHHKVFQKGVVNGYDSWYYVFAFDALVSPLEREESGRKVTLAAFFCIRPKTASSERGLQRHQIAQFSNAQPQPG